VTQADQTIIEQADICAVCGEPIEFRPGESYMASTGGKVWHMGCAPSRRQSSAVLPSEAIQTIAQVLWEKVGPAITPARAADIARDIYTAMRAATPTAPVQDDDAELADDLRYIAACHTKDPRDEDRIYEAADRIEHLSRLSPTPETELRQIAERLVDQQDEPWHLGTEADRLHYWRGKAINAARAIESLSNVSRLED
jgi:hypothetical protein